MYDVIIKDGLIVDGKGEPGFVGSIGVTGDTIELLPPFIESPECGRLIDAKGKVVCPGFIDMHSHSELSLLTLCIIIFTSLFVALIPAVYAYIKSTK